MRKHPAPLLALAGLLFAAPLAAQAAKSPSTGVVQCQKCHANRDFLVGKASSGHADSALFVTDSLLRDSRHAKLSCLDCHPGVGNGYPHSASVVAVPCQKCHEKEGEAWSQSIHASNAKTIGDAPSCVTCHTQHHVLGKDDPRSPTYALNVATLCAKCHNNPKIVGTYFKDAKSEQARNAVPEYFKTIHGTAMTKAGLVVSATCSNCHGAHLVLPADSAKSSINHANITQTCGACHAGVLATFDSSSHGQALVSGRKTPTKHAAPVCIDCHSGHKIVAANDPMWFRGVVKECGACHERLFETYFETYHGQATQLGYGLAAKCSDCHTAHAMFPPTDARSSVNPANVVATCTKCHPGATMRFAEYLPHGDPHDRAKYPLLWAVWLFMTSLLVGIFSFFGVHTVLWLIRLTIDRVRGGGSAEHETPGDGAPPTQATTGERRELVGAGSREER